METILTEAAIDEAAHVLGTEPSQIIIRTVSGGYSRNRRALAGHDGSWIFVKEVDVALLPDDGTKELAWLAKDYALTNALRPIVPEVVPESTRLSRDGNILTMTSYRPEQGWLWDAPTEPDARTKYIDSVIAATKSLEAVTFDEEAKQTLQLQPFFRDEIAHDTSLETIASSDAVRQNLIEKCTGLLNEARGTSDEPSIHGMLDFLHDPKARQRMATEAKSLARQPQNCFGHCDVRSDNLAYNTHTEQVIFVDWNWASYTPSRFGSTEFLLSMAVKGTDISAWKTECNSELLAGLVGFFLVRSLEPPLAPGNTLREMQLKSSIAALDIRNSY